MEKESTAESSINIPECFLSVKYKNGNVISTIEYREGVRDIRLVEWEYMGRSLRDSPYQKEVHFP